MFLFSRTSKLPASCCQGASESNVATYVDSTTCTATPTNFYTEGCYTRVKFYIDTYSLVTIVAGGVGILAEVFGSVSFMGFSSFSTIRAGNRASPDTFFKQNPPSWIKKGFFKTV